MAAWKTVPPELVERFDAALPRDAGVERRRMFGCPCAFVNGNMFAGLHEDRLLVRLPDEAPRRPCVMMGRTLREYAMLMEPLAMPRRELGRWIAAAFAYARRLPVKAKAPARRRGRGSSPPGSPPSPGRRTRA